MRKPLVLILILTVAILASFTNTLNHQQKKVFRQPADTWEEQLNSMNYLVMRTSSINLIKGLYLTKEQITHLQKLSLQIDALHLQMPDCKVYFNGFQKISDTYAKLIQKLLISKQLGDSLKLEVDRNRESEVDLIKRSLLASKQAGYSGEGCRDCHAPPTLFPKGSISDKDTPAISANDRKDIDLAHIKGLFGDEGTLLLWELKSEVDSLLTEQQRYVFGNFRCCLIPPEDVADPGIIGQSFVTNEWIEYFKDIRKLSESDWLKYAELYIIPLSDLVEDKLPGIKKKDKEAMIVKAKVIINKARAMDKVDFQLQKEKLCTELGTALNIDLLNGESSRSADERKFMAAIFLLFPGSNEIYVEMLK